MRAIRIPGNDGVGDRRAGLRGGRAMREHLSNSQDRYRRLVAEAKLPVGTPPAR
jgi:hypothetical protein